MSIILDPTIWSPGVVDSVLLATMSPAAVIFAAISKERSEAGTIDAL